MLAFELACLTCGDASSTTCSAASKSLSLFAVAVNGDDAAAGADERDERDDECDECDECECECECAPTCSFECDEKITRPNIFTSSPTTPTIIKISGSLMTGGSMKRPMAYDDDDDDDDDDDEQKNRPSYATMK